MRQVVMSMSGFRCVPEFPLDIPFFRRVGINMAYNCAQPIAIGWDTRATSNELVRGISAGLSEAGASHIKLGLAISPLISFGAKFGFYKTGVMVTSSHNPSEWNGFKVFGQDGTILDELSLRKLIEGQAELSTSAAQQEGPPGSLDVLETYLNSVIKLLSEFNGSAEGLHLVLDAGNGPAAVIIPRCLERMGAQVKLINGELDGIFRRQIEPRPEALLTLSKKVVDEGADMGVAFDSDGDRAVLVDEKGRVLDEDLTLALSCDFLLERLKCPVVVNVATSMLMDIVCDKHGVKLFRSAVGERNVVEEMRRVGSMIGGEGSCGGLIYMRHSPTRDGCLSAGLVASVIHESGSKISSLVDSYPNLKRGRASIEVDPRLAGIVMEEVELMTHDLEPMKLDGLRFSGDGWWVLVRPSRTEPIIRIMAEGVDEFQVRELIERYTSIVKHAYSRLSARLRK